MSSSTTGGLLAFLIVVIYATAWLLPGYLAWNWIQPESFWGAIKFLFAWSIFGYIGQLLGGLLIAGIAHLFE
jgi:hypothetical protein